MPAQKCRSSFTHQLAFDRQAFPPKRAHCGCKHGQGLLLKIRGKSIALLLLPLILSISLLIPYFPQRVEAHRISGTCLLPKQLQTQTLPLRRSFSVKKRDRNQRRQLLLVIHSCLFATPWAIPRQASVSSTISQSLLKSMSYRVGDAI